MDDIQPMTDQQIMGRQCAIVFVVISACFDIVVKGASLIVGTFQPSYILGTGLTALLLYFLWRGSKVAWWISVLCIAAAAILCLLVSTLLPVVLTVGLLGMLWLLGVLLVIPPTRDFFAYQRDKSA